MTCRLISSVDEGSHKGRLGEVGFEVGNEVGLADGGDTMLPHCVVNQLLIEGSQLF